MTPPFVAAAPERDPGFLGFVSAAISRPPLFVTETDERVWEDCTFASGLMAALNMGIDAPATREEREALRLASRDLEGGADLGDLRLAFRVRYGVDLVLPAGWREAQLFEWLEGLGGVVGQIVYRELGEPWIRWDRKFARRADGGLHAAYFDHLHPTRGIFAMDPLGRGDYSGEYIPAQDVVRALEAFRRRTGRAGFALALAPDPPALPTPPVPPPFVGAEPMTNLFPLTVKRVIDLPYRFPMLREASEDAPIYGRITRRTGVTLGLVDATATHFKVANGDSGVWISRKELDRLRIRPRPRADRDPLNVGR